MRLLHVGFTALVAVQTAACATNPVTGKRQISFMSEEQEIQTGRELDAEVRQQMGVYRDEQLEKYVEDIAMRLARQSQRPNLPWHFTIIDSPAVNAFALPGGYIYITRGILPYLDNEAQLAGVLGHEIGHVAARHSAQQYTRSAATSMGVLIGSIFMPQVRPFGQLAETGLGAMFLKYSRENELQADSLGTEYAAAGGWDPAQVPAVLTTLARIDQISDRNGTPNWLQTHPQPENRVERVQATVQKVRAASPASAAAESRNWTIDRDGYLSRINGVVFGDNPEEGITRGREFIHPDLRFAITFPEGWEIVNGEEQVTAQEPGNKIFMVLETVRQPQASLQQIAEAHMKSAGYRLTDGSATTINGLDAFVGTYQGKASGLGPVTARGAHVINAAAANSRGAGPSTRRRAGASARTGTGRDTYFIGGIAKPDDYPRVLNDFNDAIRSFRVLERDEADRVQPNRVDLYTAREGDTWQSIAQSVGKGFVKASTLAIMNNHAINDQPKPGERIKIVVAG
jgi:predicted Zn-dependent protease